MNPPSVRATGPLPQQRSWQTWLAMGGFSLLALLACSGTLWNALRLQGMGGVPWAYAGATLDPRLIPTLTPTRTRLPPTATATASPTAESALACATDPLELVNIRPEPGTTIEIGRTSLSATAEYCLGSRAQAQIGIGLIPWGPGTEPTYIPFAELSLIAAGEGVITRRINWAEFFFDPIPPGTYRFVAIMIDEFGTLISSTASEEYTFEEPAITPTP